MFTQDNDFWNELDGLGIVILLGLAAFGLYVSFFVPIVLIQLLSIENNADQLYEWLKNLHVAWRIAYIIAHMSVGILIVVTIATTVFVLVKLLFQGLIYATNWLIVSITTLIEAIVNLIVFTIGSIVNAGIVLALFPFRLIFGAADKAINYVRTKHQEKLAIRQLYEEKHADAFKNFRDFKKYFDAVQRGENPPYPNSNHQEDAHRKHKHEQKQQQKQKAKTDPYREALKLFGLNEHFTQADFKDRYRALMKQFHPDITGNNEIASKINQACATIKLRKAWT